MEIKWVSTEAKFVTPSSCGFADLDLVLTHHYEDGSTHDTRKNLTNAGYQAIVQAIELSEKKELKQGD